MNGPPTDPNRNARDEDHPRTDPGRSDEDHLRNGTGRADVDRLAADGRRPDDDRSGTGTDRRGEERASAANADGEQGRVDPDGERRARGDAATLRWLSAVVSVIGLWIAVSPFVYDVGQVALWNNVAVGGAIFLLGGYGFYRISRNYRPDAGSTGLAALLGLWAVAAPFLVAFGSEPLVWSTMASGVAVAVLSGYSAYESRRTDAPQSTGTRT